MSGGGAGPIILKSIAAIPEVPEVDRARLFIIADRSVSGCSLFDALRVAKIVMRLVRKP